MKTICTCGRKAICNCRKVNGEFVFEGEQVAIDTGKRCAVRQHVPPVLQLIYQTCLTALFP